jgi:hypothetical protein
MARRVLQDLRLSLNLYRITYDVEVEDGASLRSPRQRSQNWRQHETFATDYDTESLYKMYNRQRNLKIERVRKL